MNKRGAADRSLVFPSVVYPVSLDALAAQEEQFGMSFYFSQNKPTFYIEFITYNCTTHVRTGPLVPIVKYSSVSELEAYMKTTIFGQQAAIFSTDQASLPPLIDFLAHHVTRINLNSQCQRGYPHFYRQPCCLYVKLTIYLGLTLCRSLVVNARQSAL